MRRRPQGSLILKHFLVLSGKYNMESGSYCDNCHSAKAVAYDDRDHYIYCESCLSRVLVLGRIVYFAQVEKGNHRSSGGSHSPPVLHTGVFRSLVDHVVEWLNRWEIEEIRRIYTLKTTQRKQAPRKQKVTS